MRYWDSSVLVPLIVEQEESPRASALLAEEDHVVTWWGTRLECWGALCRLEREGRMDGATFKAGAERLQLLAARWSTIGPSEDLRRHAERLLRIHPLRAADALQLAACHIAGEGSSGRPAFLSFDRRLSAIAEREGFEVGGS
ncbi:MAG: type II toxin-antitoxin system VapC family toxin [Gemmatimonadales bacterium]